MQPWRISVGLTAALVGAGMLIVGGRLEYLAPYWPVIIADHGVMIAVHLALAVAMVAAAIYAIARAAGLSDLGRRVDLAERSVQRSAGDPDLAEELRRDVEGEWERGETGEPELPDIGLAMGIRPAIAQHAFPREAAAEAA